MKYRNVVFGQNLTKI